MQEITGIAAIFFIIVCGVGIFVCLVGIIKNLILLLLDKNNDLWKGLNPLNRIFFTKNLSDKSLILRGRLVYWVCLFVLFSCAVFLMKYAFL